MSTPQSSLAKLRDFMYSDILGGRAEGITRRDPSPVIRVGARYYVWYSRSTVTAHGYTATIWYATSPDGHVWTEQGQALGRGEQGSFDEHCVFTPSILVAGGKYYLSYTAGPEPFYMGHLPGHPAPTKTAIGMAVAKSPDGPWARVPCNPVLRCSHNPSDFDSMRVDDTCFVRHQGRYLMYYKGRQWDHTPGETKMGVAIAEAPEGPYHKAPENPVVNGGHEVCCWPHEGGVAAAFCNVGPDGQSLRWSPDGIHFERVKAFVPPPAPGPYREDQFVDSASMRLSWGISMKTADWPYLQRFDCVWDD